jgi:hypothetical protein
MGFSGIGIFAILFAMFLYIGLPVAVILLLKWMYQLKRNSDMQIEQNKRIIQFLSALTEK